MKRAWLIAVALVATDVLADSRKPPKGISLPRGCRDRGCVRGRATGGAEAPPAFEFAPTSGAGMGVACACAAVTGSAGEVMTFARASSATCLKAGTTSGIANGDMVTCSTDQPRIGTGGSGSLKLLNEGARTNEALRSQEFENAAWPEAHSVCSAAVVTANAAVAPDGTTTADRIQISSCSNYAILTQVLGSATRSASVFVKGVSGSGNLHLAIWQGASASCATCAYVAGSWSRCAVENKTTTTQIWIGWDNSDCGGGAGTVDAYIWGGQFEAGASASSYIATAGTAVARAADGAPSFTWPALVTNSAGSWAATAIAPVVSTTQEMLAAGNNSAPQMYFANNTSVSLYDGTNSVAVTVSAVSGRSVRAAASWSGSTLTVFADAVTNSTSYDGTFIGSSVYLGATSALAAPLYGWIGQVCLDPSPTRCR